MADTLYCFFKKAEIKSQRLVKVNSQILRNSEPMHTSKRKRKIANEHCVFKEWTSKYFLTEIGLCVYCVKKRWQYLKEFNLKRHHETKLKKFGCSLSEEERKLKVEECIKKLKKQQTLSRSNQLFKVAPLKQVLW